MSTKKGLTEIQSDLNSRIGQRVQLRANSGRKKFVEYTGILEGTYPNLFIVRIEEKSIERKLSFSYVDLLTGNVVLTFECDGISEQMEINHV